MLDFAEVGRRIMMRNMAPKVVTHEQIVSPLIGQLMDPEYAGEGVFITQHECANLAATIERQAKLLDASDTGALEDLLDKAEDVGRKLFKALIVSWLVATLLCGVVVGLLLR